MGEKGRRYNYAVMDNQTWFYPLWCGRRKDLRQTILPNVRPNITMPYGHNNHNTLQSPTPSTCLHPKATYIPKVLTIQKNDTSGEDACQ